MILKALYDYYHRSGDDVAPFGLEYKEIGFIIVIDRCGKFLRFEDRRIDKKSAQQFLVEGGNLAASKIRNLECPNYEICLIDYGCGKFNRKIHIMEQYP